MKKRLAIIMIGLVLIIVYIFYDKNNDFEKEIVSELINLGTIEGSQKFNFTLQNNSNHDIELEFHSPLEYNYTFDRLSDGDIDVEFEHLDLNLETTSNDRTVVLSKNDDISYSFLIHHIEPGIYEINISSDSGYGGIIKRTFTVE